MEEIKFALDTFYAVMAGALVMWMAAGFTMLEAGLCRKKMYQKLSQKTWAFIQLLASCTWYVVLRLCMLAIVILVDYSQQLVVHGHFQQVLKLIQ